MTAAAPSGPCQAGSKAPSRRGQAPRQAALSTTPGSAHPPDAAPQVTQGIPATAAAKPTHETGRGASYVREFSEPGGVKSRTGTDSVRTSPLPARLPDLGPAGAVDSRVKGAFLRRPERGIASTRSLSHPPTNPCLPSGQTALPAQPDLSRSPARLVATIDLRWTSGVPGIYLPQTCTALYQEADHSRTSFL